MADHASVFQLETVTKPDRFVVIVRGDVDSTTAPELRGVLEAAAAEIATIELDLGGVGFFDSTGISVLATTLGRLSAHGGRLQLRDTPSAIVRLLQVTDLLPLVDLIRGGAQAEGTESGC